MKPRTWPLRLREAWTAADVLLWAGLLAGPAAWLLDLGVRYAVAATACPPARRWPLAVLSAGALAAAAAGAVAAWRGRGLAPSPPAAGSPAGRRRFMAGLGLLTSAAFALAIVAQAIPALVLPPCD